MSGNNVALVFAVSSLYGCMGYYTRDIAKERLSAHFPVSQQVRVFLLWPAYWVFRILALVFWAPKKVKVIESYSGIGKMMPNWMGDGA